MRDAAPQKPANVDTNYRSLLISMFLTACFVIVSMVYVMQMNNHITNEHVNLTEAAEHILLDSNKAHLSLEEFLAGDPNINNQSSFETLFQRIRANFDKLKYTGHHTHFFLVHEKIKEVPALHQQALAAFHAIEAKTYERLAHPSDSKIGSVADQEYDKLARALNARMNQVASILRDSTNYHLNHLKNTEIITFFGADT